MSSALPSRSDLFAASLEGVGVSALQLLLLAALAKGLAVEDASKPKTGEAVLRFELAGGPPAAFAFANGEEVPEPKEEKGFTKGLDAADVGAGAEPAGE